MKSRSGPTPAITIQGGGRMAGVILMHDPPQKGRDVVFAALRVAECGTPGCRTTERPLQIFYGDPHQERWLHISPGAYRLYLIADAAHTSVTISLRGLTGQATIAPDQSQGVDLQGLQPMLDPVPAHNVYAAGNDFRLNTWGFSVTSFLARSPTSVGGEVFGDCWYRGGTRGQATAFLPPCSAVGTPVGADQGVATYNEVFAPPRQWGFGLITITHGRPKGRWGYGFWFQSPAPVEMVNGVGLFIGYR